MIILVLGAYAALLLLAACPLWAKDRRNARWASAMAVALFALGGLACACERFIDLRDRARVDFYPVRVDRDGAQSVRIQPVYPDWGYHVRHVRWADGKPVFADVSTTDLYEGWQFEGLPEKPHLHQLGCGCSPRDSLCDFPGKCGPVEIRYVVTPETRKVLEGTAIEVSCASTYRNDLAMGGAFLELTFLACLIGVVTGLAAIRRSPS